MIRTSGIDRQLVDPALTGAWVLDTEATTVRLTTKSMYGLLSVGTAAGSVDTG